MSKYKADLAFDRYCNQVAPALAAAHRIFGLIVEDPRLVPILAPSVDRDIVANWHIGHYDATLAFESETSAFWHVYDAVTEASDGWEVNPSNPTEWDDIKQRLRKMHDNRTAYDDADRVLCVYRSGRPG